MSYTGDLPSDAQLIRQGITGTPNVRWVQFGDGQGITSDSTLSVQSELTFNEDYIGRINASTGWATGNDTIHVGFGASATTAQIGLLVWNTAFTITIASHNSSKLVFKHESGYLNANSSKYLLAGAEMAWFTTEYDWSNISYTSARTLIEEATLRGTVIGGRPFLSAGSQSTESHLVFNGHRGTPPIVTYMTAGSYSIWSVGFRPLVASTNDTATFGDVWFEMVASNNRQYQRFNYKYEK